MERSVRINFIYRASPGHSKKESRPDYFDKKNCLVSFLKSVSKLPSNNCGTLIFLNDGDIENSLLALMNSVDSEIINLSGVGNSESLRYAHSLVLTRDWDDGDLIYFAEDDYLYRKEALQYLLNASVDINEADYFTLYDHPDRYTRKDDVRNGLSKVYINRDCHWRTVESTPQSFGVRIKAFKRDAWIHKLGTMFNTPRGREMFRAVQGIGKYRWKFPKHMLISPIPSLATHMETEFLSKNIDWQEVNDSSFSL